MSEGQLRARLEAQSGACALADLLSYALEHSLPAYLTLIQRLIFALTHGLPAH
jgi:hypothetical protein